MTLSIPERTSSEVQQFVGAQHMESVGQGMTDKDKRAAIDRAAAAVESTFLEWHRSGCMTAAADYARARNAWAGMLMKWGAV